MKCVKHLAAVGVVAAATAFLGTTAQGAAIAADQFDYPDGSLVPNGGWVNHSGTAGDLLVSAGQAVVQHGVPSEDASLPFTPVTGNIYFGIDFSVDDLGAPYTPGGDYEYFAHFKDGSFGFRGRVDVVPPAGAGDFSVGLATGGGTADVLWPSDLQYATTYRAIVRYDQDNDVAELWINASAEGDPSIIAATNTSPLTMIAFALRQSDSTENETVRVDNLVIGTTFADVAGEENPPEAPTITLNPVSQTVAVGETTVLSGGASGSPFPTYQWYKNGALLSGETGAALTFPVTVHTNAGNYHFVASNALGSATSSVATLTVEGFALFPAIQNTNTISGVSVSVPIPIFDNQSPITSVTATSGNQALLANGNISSSGSGSNWSLNLAPTPGTNGVAIVTVTVGDGSFSTSATFGLIVTPSSGVYFNEYFNYPDSSLTSAGSNVWFNHSGAPGSLQVVFERAAVSQGASEDVNATLIGAPYAPDPGQVLYSKFTIQSLALPNTTNGNYFAHFKDDTAFGFRARVFATTNAPSGTFRLGIGNSSDWDTTGVVFPADLQVGVDYTVVTRLDLATGESTLWVDPSLESDTSVTDTSGLPGTQTPVPIYSYALRQSGGIGENDIDDLVVGGSFDAVMNGAPVPIPLAIETSGGDVVLTWGDPAFRLESAPAPSGTYTNVAGATSPYTHPAGAAAKYFRLANP